MIDALWMAGLVVFALAGVALSVFQLPGAWVTLAAAAVFDWHHGWARLGWKWLAVLAVMAVAAEVFEFAASAVLARRAGASRRASFGALAGGFMGMFLCTGIVPIPVLGTITGGCIGCFVGALVGEMSLHDDFDQGAKVGFWATAGRIMGLVAKTCVSMLMAGMAVVVGWGGW